MDLSVIIVNYNTKKLLINCIESVIRNTKDVKYEIIVVDNDSRDGSQGAVGKKYPQVNLILNKSNLGFSKANNQGIKKAKGNYIFLLNSDTFLVENSFKKLLIDIRPRAKLGAIGPQLLNEDMSIQQSAGFFPGLSKVFFWMTFIDDLPGGSYLKPYHVDHNSFYKNGQEVDWVTGAAILIPKNITKSVGVLDQHIFMYGEEVEWCYRIKKAGFKIYYSPATKIVHIGRGSHDKTPTNAIVGEYKGLLYFYKKHEPKFALQILKLLLKIGTLVRIIIFASLGRKELSTAYVEAYKLLRQY